MDLKSLQLRPYIAQYASTQVKLVKSDVALHPLRLVSNVAEHHSHPL